MPKKIIFENHFALRVVEIIFPDGFSIESDEDLILLKNEWTKNLKSWHSPYVCLFDLRKFQIAENMQSPFEKMLKFFGNFFMRKIIGFVEVGTVPPKLSFEILSSYEEGSKAAGLEKGGSLGRNLDNLRSRIQIDNDFNAHVMEIQFLAPTDFLTKDDVYILRDKIKNILRQWHTPYSLLFNCVNCTFSTEVHAEFAKVEKFLKSFFCKNIIGYAPKIAKENYPFKTFRSRHLAAAELSNSGLQSGAEANCSSRKLAK